MEKVFLKLSKIVKIIILTLLIKGFIVWMLVEFILYLFKDHSFNWWSVYSSLITIPVLIISIFFIELRANKEKKEWIDSLKAKESKWDRKIKELRDKRNA